MQVNATAAEHPGEPLYLRVAWRCDVVLFLDSACGGRGRSIIGKGSEGSGLSG